MEMETSICMETNGNIYFHGNKWKHLFLWKQRETSTSMETSISNSTYFLNTLKAPVNMVEIGLSINRDRPIIYDPVLLTDQTQFCVTNYTLFPIKCTTFDQDPLATIQDNGPRSKGVHYIGNRVECMSCPQATATVDNDLLICLLFCQSG